MHNMKRKAKSVLSVVLAVLVLLPTMMAGTASPAKAAPNGIVKYAVSVYDIGKDIDEYGDRMGLTFGPALGDNYIKSFKSHEPTGDTTEGNAHRCIHNDDWETIIMWNFIDPYVYEQCIGQGCTHSVELDLNRAETLMNPEFDSSYTTGDGPSMLYRELRTMSTNDENLRWNPKTEGGSSSVGTNKLGWGATRIRAMLNGRDELDVLGSDYASSASSDPNKDYGIYTDTNCLLNAFPSELKAAMGRKAVKYDSVYNQKTEANLKTSYDKLWLLSPNEIWTTSQNASSYSGHPLEGEQYQYFAKAAERGRTIAESTSKQNVSVGYMINESNGNSSGRSYYWWLRSFYPNTRSDAMYIIDVGRINNAGAYANSGVAPCFTLSGNSEDSVKLILDTNGGYTENSIVRSETTSVTVPEAVRPGYYLTGWNAAKDGTGTMYQPGDEINATLGDVIFLYAQWGVAPKYQVKHFQQNIDETGYDLVETETLYGIPNQESTPEPKTYDGFITPEPQSVVVQEDNSSILEYRYDRTHYTVSFDANGGEGVMGEQRMTGGINAKLYDNNYTRTGFVFNGWNTEQDGSGTAYGDAQAVVNLAGNGETKTLYAQWLDISSSVQQLTEGKYTITLRSGQTLTIPELPAGTKFKIKEVNLPNGWTIRAENGTEGEIKATENSAATVMNQYFAEGSVSLVAYKTMNTGNVEPGAFEFQLLQGSTVLQAAKNGAVDNQEYILAPNGIDTIKNPYYGMSVIRFNDIQLTSAGSKTYTIKEVAGTDSSIQYDSHSESVRVVASDNGQGTLAATVTYDSDGPVFENTKIPQIPDPQKQGKLMVSKKVSNYPACTKPFDFVVTLTDDNGTELTDEYSYDIIKTGFEDKEYKTEHRVESRAVSHTQNIDDEGVKQSNYGNAWNNSHIRGTGRETAVSQAHVITFPGAENMHVKITYGGESASYDYVVMWAGNYPNYTAYNNSGSSVTGRLGGGKAVNASNTKEYDVPGDTVTFSYRSDGSGVGDGYGYYAVVTASTVSYEYQEGYISSGTVSSGDTIQLKSGETAIIEGLPAGVHYKIEEVEAEGYELISSENTEGLIEADQTQKAAFDNAFTGEAEAEFHLTKRFDGDLQGGDFTFRLYDSDGTLLQETTNDAEGNIVFAPITYSAEDIGQRYGYTVTEVNDAKENIIYDEHEENIVVSIEDHEGEIETSVEYRDGGEFVNEYDTGDMTISKTVTGNMGSKDRAFTIQVSLSKNGEPFNGTLQAEGTTDQTEVTFVDGVGTVSLKHNDTITIKEIKNGTDYVVTEVGYKPYTPTITGGTGKITPEGANVVIENNLVKDIPTMVHIHGWKAAIVLLGVALAGIVMLKKRNSKNTI